MKKLAKIAIIATSLFASAFAHAANPNVFDLGKLETTDSISRIVGKPAFSDIYNFTLGTGATYDLLFDLKPLDTIAEKFAYSPSFGFMLFSGTLKSNNDLNRATAVLGSNFGSFASNLSATGLGAGNYSLHVFGKGRSDDSAYLTNAIGITAHPIAAIPEPENYVMLLAGLVLIGAVARRRKAMQI